MTPAILSAPMCRPHPTRPTWPRSGATRMRTPSSSVTQTAGGAIWGAPGYVFLGSTTIVYGSGENDLIDARAATTGLTIYGGDGSDTIWGGQGDDHIDGGSSNDEIHGQGGYDHIYGDSSFNVDNEIGPSSNDPNMNRAIALGDLVGAGMDTISGDSGNDIVFGDHGVVKQSLGTLKILSVNNVEEIYSNNLSNSADDLIEGGYRRRHPRGWRR